MSPCGGGADDVTVCGALVGSVRGVHGKTIGTSYGCEAGHGAEIRYVFELDQYPRAWSPGDRQLARELVGYWTNFAKTGDPNGEGLAIWPAFDGTKANVMHLGTAAEIRERGALPDFDSFADR